MTSPTPRGRPPVAEASALRARAIALFAQHGYEALTMSALAQQLGVSVRTLHRYFPSKSDMVWSGLEGGIEALRAGLEAADPRSSIVDAVSVAMVRAFAREQEHAVTARARLRLIALTPELQTTRPETYTGWRDETIAFVARRMDLPTDHVIPRAVGTALQAAITEALVWWALQDDGSDPVDAVTRALSGLREVG